MEKGPVAGGCSCSCNGDTQKNENHCCNQMPSANINGKYMPWMTGEIETSAGKKFRVSTEYTVSDRLGAWKARWGIGRMNYKIPPGLYGVGNPDADSLVLVSANYKMSFDRLRSELKGLNLWILVLDTKGINVWCAAGKGTFGTEELVNRISLVKLSEIVTHRTLVVPQLGAPGVSAHKVLQLSGFKVVYGPVRAADVPAFISAGLKATAAMRVVRFDMRDRLVLAPFELVSTIKPALILIAFLFLMNLAVGKEAFTLGLLSHTMIDFIPYLGAILTGTVLVPLLLPYIPGPAFSWKGWLMGLLWAGVYVWCSASQASWGYGLFYCLILPPIASYLAMNFTGCSTYTSLSGVAKEMKFAVPAQIISVVGGIALWVGRLFLGF
ncbi:co dehydrogenase/acetyl-coa synthase delta subunit tim barrel [Lucifera butyrica]|uniref:Co dehydrogenase/acetyl-coa synthase delta subunit tim barrel n=1 Tax=Lucifera butyrica TaxID=1351585 RepID=A0A498R4V6_9FIRM|nr:mercury methylation corrinoid protein HgcA [Lucifera butyrica]VBB07726.1 co dehydrogenase/acetyl-coa synthase delta subunit tim barrel [Lucifera butyrica]